MLPKMQAQPLRQEVQRAVRERGRQAVGAVLLPGQQAARVLADLAGGAQRVRPDDARQRARARRRGPRGRARPRGAVRGRPRDAAFASGATTGASATSARRSSSTPAARRRCCRTGSSCASGIPILNKGAIWTYWQGAYRDTGRDEGATIVLQTADQERLVLVHPAARRHRQRRRRRAVRLPVQGRAARTTSRPTTKRSSAAPP